MPEISYQNPEPIAQKEEFFLNIGRLSNEKLDNIQKYFVPTHIFFMGKERYISVPTKEGKPYGIRIKSTRILKNLKNPDHIVYLYD